MTDLNIITFGNGAGTPVFLIHGFTGDARRWVLLEDLIGPLHQMHAVEMPNHGASPKRPIADFDALVAEIVAAFDATGLPRAHVVGHSLGGALATRLAAARPEACASLTLLGPAGLGPKAAGDILKGVANSTEADDLRRYMLHLVHDPALISDAFVALAVETRADATLRTAQDAMGDTLFPGGDVAFDVVPVLHALEVPTQIIWGRQDQILPVADAMAAPGEVALHLFDQMGHVPQLEAPEAVARLMLRHFRGAEDR